MTVVLAFLVGLLVVLALEAGGREVLARPVLARRNYRDHELATAAGLLLVVAVVLVEGARTVIELLGASDGATAPDRLLVVAVVVAFGTLGLIDDVLGDDAEKGLAGHVRAALHGRITTGAIKLAGGASFALVAAAVLGADRPVQTIVDAALIALAANLANLFDRAPGRTIKVGLLAWAPLAIVAGTSAAGLAVAVVAGGAAGLLRADLAERSMIGDTGANALGAGLGVAAVLVLGPGARAVVAAILLALTLASEVVSFSRVIDRTPPLRAADRLGRRRPEAGG
ncbi:MAG: hypothetical protein KDB04_08780 [Acidimicrobiales bacterium]|nr:hypothetical protein [Acidimicrobiales bacterium]HRW38680.1 hypothetical protein [Aquihabitans sp.]